MHGEEYVLPFKTGMLLKDIRCKLASHFSIKNNFKCIETNTNKELGRRSPLRNHATYKIEIRQYKPHHGNTFFTDVQKKGGSKSFNQVFVKSIEKAFEIKQEYIHIENIGKIGLKRQRKVRVVFRIENLIDSIIFLSKKLHFNGKSYRIKQYET